MLDAFSPSSGRLTDRGNNGGKCAALEKVVHHLLDPHLSPLHQLIQPTWQQITKHIRALKWVNQLWEFCPSPPGSSSLPAPPADPVHVTADHQARVSSKQTKIIFGSNRNKPKQDLFRFCFGLFHETNNKKFRFVSVFRTYIETTETNRTVS